MGIGFLKNVYNMQTSLVPYSSMGHAMPLPTQILQESDSLLSNRKGSSQDCHRPDGAQGLLTRGFRQACREVRADMYSIYLVTSIPKSKFEHKYWELCRQNKKWFENYQCTWHARRSPTLNPVWACWQIHLPRSFWRWYPCSWHPWSFSYFFLFLGFLLFHFRVIFGVVHQENDGFLRFHRDRCPWRQLVVTQAQVHLQGIVKKLVAVGPRNKNG